MRSGKKMWKTSNGMMKAVFIESCPDTSYSRTWAHAHTPTWAGYTKIKATYSIEQQWHTVFILLYLADMK